MEKNTENTGTNTNIVALQEMNIDELRGKASAMGLTVSDEDGKDEVVDQIVEALTEGKDEGHGTLVSLKTTFFEATGGLDEVATARAQNLIRTVRDRIIEAQRAGSYHTMFLQTKEKKKYTQRAPGVKLSEKSLPEILALVSPLPDGSQNELLAEFTSNPEKFQQPILVHVKRRNRDGSFGDYVMLYLDRKVNRAVSAF